MTTQIFTQFSFEPFSLPPLVRVDFLLVKLSFVFECERSHVELETNLRNFQSSCKFRMIEKGRVQYRSIGNLDQHVTDH